MASWGHLMFHLQPVRWSWVINLSVEIKQKLSINAHLYSLFLLPNVSSMNLDPVRTIWQRKRTLEVYCTQGVSAAGDRITTILSLGAGAAPGRQLSRWSTCSKLSPPHRGSRGPAGALLCPYSSVQRRRLARPAESTQCAKLGAFCTTVSQQKHADKNP